MEIATQKQQNELSTYQKRIEILVGARFKDTNQMTLAKQTQDILRKKIGRWFGAEEIRKWRMRRK